MTLDKLKDLDFFASTHRYTYMGREILSVTQAIGAVGISDFSNVPTEDLERAREIGVVVHEIAHLYGQSVLDENSVDLELIGYLNAIKLFYAERVKKIIDLEFKLYNAYFRFAGQCDILYESFDGKIYLDDYKTAKQALPAAKLQTSAYKYSTEKLYKIKIAGRAGVRLDNQGRYKRYPYHGQEDFHIFIQALGVAQWKIKNKIRT